nr:MAG TPA: hypothetical protein [Caudoviricetes sp.]
MISALRSLRSSQNLKKFFSVFFIICISSCLPAPGVRAVCAAADGCGRYFRRLVRLDPACN